MLECQPGQHDVIGFFPLVEPSQRLRESRHRWCAARGGRVGQRDGIWLTIQSQSDREKPARRRRRRKAGKGQRVVVLVALGTARMAVAEARAALGSSPEAKLGLVHARRTVVDQTRSEGKGEERQQFVEQARALAQAHDWLARWARDWRERRP